MTMYCETAIWLRKDTIGTVKRLRRTSDLDQADLSGARDADVLSAHFHDRTQAAHSRCEASPSLRATVSARELRALVDADSFSEKYIYGTTRKSDGIGLPALPAQGCPYIQHVRGSFGDCRNRGSIWPDSSGTTGLLALAARPGDRRRGRTNSVRTLQP